MNPHNYRTITTTCPECHSNDIRYDLEYEIGVTYCGHCGLVITDNTIFSIKKYLENEEYREKVIWNLWKTRKKKK